MSTDEQETKKWLKNDVTARSIIVRGVSNAQLELIINEAKAVHIINELKSIYEPPYTSLKFIAKRKLLELKMKENYDPKEFLTKFKKHINDLRNTGESVKEEDQLNYLFLALPESFSNIVDIVDKVHRHPITDR
ncbi:hypothetical protein JTB14_001687 [Gonioctena quinquepunctata]|nr:hypothetical protein JTB14_001687 [Gonioctena quinquepunctata]